MNIQSIREATLVIADARRKLAEADMRITPEQLVVLEYLADLPVDEPSTMGGVSTLMQVTPAVATGLVDRLEKRKMVERIGRGGDRRVSHIAITDAGVSMLLQAGVALKGAESA